MARTRRSNLETRAHFDNQRVDLARAEAVLRDKRRWQRESRLAAPPGLVKKGGRLVSNDSIVNPEFVKTGRIEKSFPSKDALILRSTISKGFSNRDGWRCYWNSMLQVFLHAPPVYSLLGNFHRDCTRGPSRCVPCTLQQLAQNYWNPTGAVEVSTDDIHKANRRNIRRDDVNIGDYHHRRQNDSSCYMHFMIEQLLRVSNNTQRTSIEKVFHFHTQAHITCVVCGHRQDWNMLTDQLGFQTYLRDPRRRLSVEDYLRQAVFTEQGRFTCDSDDCEERQKDPDYETPMQTRITTIHYCADVLLIQLCRFLVNEHGNIKITDDNDFQEVIDLGPYTTTPTIPARYRFSGLVAHTGPTADSGHYISVVRNPDQSYRVISDSTVHTSNDFDRDVKLPKWNGSKFDPLPTTASLLWPCGVRCRDTAQVETVKDSSGLFLPFVAQPSAPCPKVYQSIGEATQYIPMS